MDLLNFLNDSPMAFHAAANVAAELRRNGYTELRETEHWELKDGEGYFVDRNNSGIIAFHTPENGGGQRFNIALTHLDSPGLRFKMHGATVEAGILAVPVERYSQNIDSTWLDHPLALAGRIVTRDQNVHLVTFKAPVAVIPNLATHLKPAPRDAPSAYNPQTELRAFFGDITPDELHKAIADNAGCAPQDILAAELAPYDCTPPAIIGIHHDLINAPRLDNLLAAHALLTAMAETDRPCAEAIAVGAFFDNEEIGSQTPQGANSTFLANILERITLARGMNREGFFRAIAASRLLSVDAAHALHPNYAPRYDLTAAPIMNRGIVLKSNANGRYTTNAVTEAEIKTICERDDIPLQFFTMRSDQSCGSTVGPMTAAQLGICGADVGNALWAMHSVRETGGLKDQLDMTRLIGAFLK